MFLSKTTENALPLLQFSNNHSYKIVQCYMILCKHIILMKQLNSKDNKVSFDILMMKIDQILIKLDDILGKKIPKMHYPLYV